MAERTAAQPLLLGSVKFVAADGTDVRIPTGERALLSRLPIDVGRVVRVERLVDDLWGENPPARVRNSVQVHVSSAPAA